LTSLVVIQPPREGRRIVHCTSSVRPSARPSVHPLTGWQTS